MTPLYFPTNLLISSLEHPSCPNMADNMFISFEERFFDVSKST